MDQVNVHAHAHGGNQVDLINAAHALWTIAFRISLTRANQTAQSAAAEHVFDTLTFKSSTGALFHTMSMDARSLGAYMFPSAGASDEAVDPNEPLELVLLSLRLKRILPTSFHVTF
jgi:hypothetical protein